MIKALFVRVNPKTDRISWSSKAKFTKTFKDIEELVKFVINCKGAAITRSTLSADENAIFRSKIFAVARKKLNDC